MFENRECSATESSKDGTSRTSLEQGLLRTRDSRCSLFVTSKCQSVSIVKVHKT